MLASLTFPAKAEGLLSFYEQPNLTKKATSLLTLISNYSWPHLWLLSESRDQQCRQGSKRRCVAQLIRWEPFSHDLVGRSCFKYLPYPRVSALLSTHCLHKMWQGPSGAASGAEEARRSRRWPWCCGGFSLSLPLGPSAQCRHVVRGLNTVRSQGRDAWAGHRTVCNWWTQNGKLWCTNSSEATSASVGW